IVGQDPVAAFAQPGTGTRHHFGTVEIPAVALDPDLPAVCETLERNFFHRSAPPSVCEHCIVNDAATAAVDAMARVERTLRDQVRGEREFMCGLLWGNVHGKTLATQFPGGDCTKVRSIPRFNGFPRRDLLRCGGSGGLTFIRSL